MCRREPLSSDEEGHRVNGSRCAANKRAWRAVCDLGTMGGRAGCLVYIAPGRIVVMARAVGPVLSVEERRDPDSASRGGCSLPARLGN